MQFCIKKWNFTADNTKHYFNYILKYKDQKEREREKCTQIFMQILDFD